MSWRAICNPNNPAGSGPGAPSDAGETNGILSRGTFLAEFDPPEDGETQLLQFSTDGEWELTFDLSMEESGAISLTLSQKQGSVDAQTPALPDVTSEGLRVWFSWDAPAREATIAAEALQSGNMVSADAGAPFPLPLSDIARMKVRFDARDNASPLRFFGFSDELLLAGPAPGLAADTPIETPEGWRKISTLEPGELITTLDHGDVPVCAIRALEVPAIGQFRPLRLRAPYFDLSQDIVVAPHLKLLLGGDMVEYLFGEEEVFVEAEQLIDGKTALEEIDYETINYYQIVLDQHEILNAAGAQVESLFLPDGKSGSPLSRRIGVAHEETARLVLKPYEALTLRSVRYR